MACILRRRSTPAGSWISLPQAQAALGDPPLTRPPQLATALQPRRHTRGDLTARHWCPGNHRETDVMATFHCRSAFISDVHLGTPDCKARYLLDFLRQLRCERLYLVGDIIDLEALGKRMWWHADHSAVIAEILDMARRGIEVTYIPGNHDAALRGLVGQSFGGVRIALDAVHEGADGRRYRVSHGDEFDPEQVGRRWMLHLGEAMHRFICWSNRRVHAGASAWRCPTCRCRSS